MVTPFKGTLFYCDVLGGSWVGAVSEDVEWRRRARPPAEVVGGGILLTGK